MSEPAEAETIRREAVDLLKSKVGFHKYLWGWYSGELEKDGTASFSDPYTDMPGDFARRYALVKRIDTVGRLFFAFPKVVQVIPVNEFQSRTDPNRQEMFDYLAEKFNVANLMLVGTRSSYGYAWITLYRLGKTINVDDSGTRAVRPDDRFTQQQAEFAARAAPYFLYRWQQARASSTSLSPDERASIERAAKNLPNSLLPLSFDQLSVALDIVQDRTADEIAPKHNVGAAAIRKRRRVLRDLLDLEGDDGLLDRLLGDL